MLTFKYMNNPVRTLVIIGIISLLFIVAGCSTKSKLDPNIAQEKATILKSANCGCCGIYSQYMDRKGFDVEVKNTENMDAVKNKNGIPSSMQSCHTTEIGNYFVEGHIPHEAVVKLLNEKPDIAGIAMPGMPSGSPGMPGAKTGDFVIYAVHHNGNIEEFMRI